MEIKLLVFGQLSDITKCTEMKIAEVNDTQQLIINLTTQFPELELSKYSIAVNRKVIFENKMLTDNDTVALLPPFSGG
jgi:sulfur-carrier protein